jgi:hypothetical protein
MVEQQIQQQTKASFQVKDYENRLREGDQTQGLFAGLWARIPWSLKRPSGSSNRFQNIWLLKVNT